MKIYSKKNIINAASAMRRNDRFFHGIILTGETGTGRKLAADYIASALLCESPLPDGSPCGECRNCRRAEKHTHPDIIYPEPSGKNNTYGVDYLREEIILDTTVLPNDGDAKVYIFRDCDNMSTAAQDTLLKVIEEPPDHVYFIFTVHSQGAFLPTIISRTITLPVNECTDEECAEALSACGKYTPEQITEAVSAFHGNIGLCTDFLENGTSRELYDIVCSAASGMVSGNEYEILKALSAAGGSRDKFRSVMIMLDKVICDAMRIRSDGSAAKCIGCCPKQSEALSARLTVSAAENIHEILLKAQGWCSPVININISAAACAVSARLAGKR